jgi:hypothetical protein
MRRWFPGCCASAASGHVPTKPETIFMNSRRCMAFLPREGHFRRLEEYQITALALCLWSQAANVRNGSLADIEGPDVRFTPKADIGGDGCDVRFVPEADVGKTFTAVLPTQQSRWPGQ